MSNPDEPLISEEMQQCLRDVSERAAQAARAWVQQFASVAADSLEKITVALEEATRVMAESRAQEDDTQRETDDMKDAYAYDHIDDVWDADELIYPPFED